MYKDHIMYVILMDLLELPEYDEYWPWEKVDLHNMAIQQRGHPPKCAVGNKVYDPSPFCLKKPTSLPRSLSPVYEDTCAERAGMAPRRQHDPKTIMYGWAEQKIRDEAPEAQGKTIAMIMRAEPRTVTAIMHAKSPAQTKEVIIAAFRRAGLPSPFHPLPQPVPPQNPNIEAMMHAMTEQTRILGEMALNLAETPKAEH